MFRAKIFRCRMVDWENYRLKMNDVGRLKHRRSATVETIVANAFAILWLTIVVGRLCVRKTLSVCFCQTIVKRHSVAGGRVSAKTDQNHEDDKNDLHY